MSVKYDRVASISMDDDTLDSVESSLVTHTNRMSAITMTTEVPITRPPPKARDSAFAVAFLLHFGAFAMLSLMEQKSLRNSIILYGKAGSWASIIMIVTLMGGFIGTILAVQLTYGDIRDSIMPMGLPFSIVFQICLGNILLLLQTDYSYLGIIFLISALVDYFRCSHARHNISFTSTLMEMCVDIWHSYGISLPMAFLTIILAQTFLLLWWGVFVIGLMSEVTVGYTGLLLVLMGFSLYWTTQFFHAFMSYVAGGCVLWHFLRDEATDRSAPADRVLLHLQCGLTTSFGSLCKGALLSPPAQLLLMLHHWSTGSSYNSHSNNNTNNSNNSNNNNNSSFVPRCSCTVRGLVQCLTSPLVNWAYRHHQLSYCLSASFGHTFCKAAQDQTARHPETVVLSVEDSSSFALTMLVTAVAGSGAVIVGIFAERRQGASWPLFFFVIYYLSFCGLSLALQTYRGSVDALIVAFAAKPERFAVENQIVFLRFLRQTESALR